MTTIQILEGHSGVVFCLIVWNNHLYSGSDDKTIRKWGEYHFQHYKFLSDDKKKDVRNAMILFRRLRIFDKDTQLSIVRELIKN